MIRLIVKKPKINNIFIMLKKFSVKNNIVSVLHDSNLQILHFVFCFALYFKVETNMKLKFIYKFLAGVI